MKLLQEKIHKLFMPELTQEMCIITVGMYQTNALHQETKNDNINLSEIF